MSQGRQLVQGIGHWGLGIGVSFDPISPLTTALRSADLTQNRQTSYETSISLVIPLSSSQVNSSGGNVEKRPYCAEQIDDEAIKCKHCGEFLNNELISKEVKRLGKQIQRRNYEWGGLLTFWMGAIGIMATYGSDFFLSLGIDSTAANVGLFTLTGVGLVMWIYGRYDQFHKRR